MCKQIHIITRILGVIGVNMAMTTFALAVSPSWQAQDTVDLTAFRYKTELPTLDHLTVPTVVEVRVPNGVFQNKSAVAIDDDATVLPTFYKRYTKDVPTVTVGLEGRVAPNDPLAAAWNYTPEESPSNLVDGDQVSTVEFDYTDNAVNSATVYMTYASPITTSEFYSTRAAHVRLPATVQIRAQETMGNAGVVRNVLATTKPTGDIVRFPEVTAKFFEVTFTFVQPLRLSEVSFVPTRTAAQKDGIRFLAQPGKRYTLYMDPDRTYGTPPAEGLDLRSDKEVYVVAAQRITGNPQYVAVDTDHDGVPNTEDNCPHVANTDQADVNHNGQGDACDDFDRDGVVTSKDNCPDTPNLDQRDTDHDGIGDVCDTYDDRFTERNPWVPWAGMGVAAATLIGLLILAVRQRPVTSGVESDADIEGDTTPKTGTDTTP